MNENSTILSFAVAYATGYYDGRTSGTQANVYTDNTQRTAYRLGYDRGVSDYCEELEGEMQ